MKILKADLPDGVKKKFIVKIGKKVKLVNRKNFPKHVKQGKKQEK